jgi:hypothetical protein
MLPFEPSRLPAVEHLPIVDRRGGCCFGDPVDDGSGTGFYATTMASVLCSSRFLSTTSTA